MARASPRAEGVTLMEMVVTMAIIIVLATMAAPSFSQFLQNAQVRTAAESLANGLRLARTESIRRNTLVRFQLTTSLDAGCILSTADGNWVISIDDPTRQCASVGVTDAYALSDSTHNPAPRILQKYSMAEGARSAAVTADQSTIVFNGIGRITPAPASVIQFNITNPEAGACAAQSGPVRCLRVVVSQGGQVRQCDPAYASSDPRGC